MKRLRKISLSDEEKEAVLSRLLAYVESHPAVEVPQKSFIQNLLASPYQTIFAFRYEYAIASMIIILVSGGAVASASENALPGDMLYPIKIGITEPLRGVFIVGDAPKAHWEIEKTVRRLEEVETLAAQNRLTESALQLAQDNFQKSAVEFDAIVHNGESVASSTQLIDARIDFEAKMNAHSVILLSVASSSPVVEQKLFAPLVTAVEQSSHSSREDRADSAKVFLQSVRGTRDNREDGDRKNNQVNSGGGEHKDAQRLFESKAQAVQNMIDRTATRLSDMASSTAVASTSVQAVILDTVPATLKNAENSLKDAKEKQDSGESDKAFSALLDSESAAKQADVSTKQGIKLGREERNSQKDQNTDSGSKNDPRGQDGGGEKGSGDKHSGRGND